MRHISLLGLGLLALSSAPTTNAMSQEPTDAEICVRLQAHAETMNADPRYSDEGLKSRAIIDCEGKVFVVEASFPAGMEFSDDERSRMREVLAPTFEQTICDVLGWEAAFERGWSVRAEYRLGSGNAFEPIAIQSCD